MMKISVFILETSTDVCSLSVKLYVCLLFKDGCMNVKGVDNKKLDGVVQYCG